ncbi:MAG: rhodanese-like domain-containing protein [Candidatus Limnocylindria bacterium]
MPRAIDRDEVRRLAEQGAQIVDVLPRQEYEDAHLPGSISLPLKELTDENVERLLRRDRPVVVYCWDAL